METKFSAFDFEYNISRFHAYINEITLKDSELSFEERRVKISESLKFDEFLAKLREIFSQDLDESYVKKFFKKITQNPNSAIDWSELFGYSLEDKSVDKSENKEEDANQIDNLLEEVQIFMAAYKFRIGDASGEKARRDIIQFIHYTPDIDSFITVAQKGAVSIWNNRLKLNGCIFLKEQVDGWLNGCCFLPNLKRVVITAERSLTLWDFRNTKQSKSNSNFNLLTVSSLSNLTCLDSINKFNQHKESDKLIMGDSFGNIMVLEININDLSFNNTKQSLIDPQKRVIELDSLKNSFIKKKIHDDAVTKIKYIPELNCFVSCSSSEKISLVIEELVKFETKDIKINRQVGINKGLTTFCYCSKLNLIATGGVDKAIRLYNPLVLSKSCGKLIGHLFTIVDLVCNEKDQQLISLSSERVFRVWDLTTFKCLQVFSDTETRPGEKRIYCIQFDQKRDRLLTCSSVLDCWPLTRSITDTMLPPHTHDRPLITIRYSHNQIVTLCAESTLKVWEADTGRLIYSRKEIHGKSIDATCLTIDSTGNRLATGASDGSIKIWNFSTGHEIKHYNGSTQRIVCLNYVLIKNELYLIVCDFNNVIKIYTDSSEDLSLLQILTKSTNGKDSSLNRFEKLPPIRNTSQESNQENLRRSRFSSMSYFNLNTINTFYYAENNWLLTATNYISVWDLLVLDLKEVFGLNEDKDDYECKSSFIYSIKVVLNTHKKIEFSVKDDLDQNDKSTIIENTIQESSRKNSIISSDGTNEHTEEESHKELEHYNKAFFKYIIITAHEDAIVKFWNEKGEIINEIPTIASIKPSAITSICFDHESKYLYTGDLSGYITIWSLGQFLNSFDLTEAIDIDENFSKINMVVCFRAHLHKIIDLIYIPSTKLLLSASVDESVRAWDGLKGKYIGFLGQSKILSKPSYESNEWASPFDINEPPIYHNRSKDVKKSIEKNYEYPLILDKNRLINKTGPIRSLKFPSISSVYSSRNDTLRNSESFFNNEKYFTALVKPKHTFNESELLSRSQGAEGCIFSSLPLYNETQSVDSEEFKILVNSISQKYNKEITTLANEKKAGTKVNFKTNIKVYK